MQSDKVNLQGARWGTGIGIYSSVLGIVVTGLTLARGGRFLEVQPRITSQALHYDCVYAYSFYNFLRCALD